IKLDGPIVIQGVEMTRREGYFVLLWDANSGKEIRRFGGLKDKIKAVVFSPDGKVLAAASRDGRVCLWDGETAQSRLFVLAHPQPVDLPFTSSPCIAFAPDGQTLVSAGTDRTLRVWNSTTGEEVRHYPSPDSALTAIALGRDGKTVVTGSTDTGVLIWDI